MDSGNANLPFQTLFLCPPPELCIKSLDLTDEAMAKYFPPNVELPSTLHFHGNAQQNKSSAYYLERLDSPPNHDVLPLFWCNNREEYLYCHCRACDGGGRLGSDYYYCVKCDEKYHKECVESPLQIQHPYHSKHPLQLCYELSNFNSLKCFYCEKYTGKMVYHCPLCKISIHPGCVLGPVSFVIDQAKGHGHPLTFFTRKAPLDCNVCGLVSNVHPTYVCLQCDFVAHRYCADSPRVIRICRHHHRLSFTLSLPLPGKRSCGVCRKDVDSEYGAYTCNKCDDCYVVHSRCALRDDVWDGEELDGVPEEEDDMNEFVEPYERISDGVILHFSHNHRLRLEAITVYDDSKICQACVLPIYEGDFYSCKECDFILHVTCANASRKKRLPLHPHPLTLKVINRNDGKGFFKCNACQCKGSGFIYECSGKGCCFELDVRCALISDPYDYQGHEHPLYLALDPAGERRYCQVCHQTSPKKLLNCIECDFIICFDCVTLPYMARYKHDKHFLTLGYGDETTSKPDWCEVCEERLPLQGKERFYKCNHCCTTLHIKCLLGEDPYMKSGYTIKPIYGIDVKILPNNSLSRPTCEWCESRCGSRIYFRLDDTENEKTWCSMNHMKPISFLT